MLWKAIFLLDAAEIQRICGEWGIMDGDMFASMQLMKPYSTSKPVGVKRTREEIVKMQKEAKANIKQVLANTELIPRELIFVGRNMNLVRANNKHLDSPVNRVNILASRAVAGSATHFSVYERFSFHLRLMLLSVAFSLTQTWRSVRRYFGATATGFEELIDEGERMARDKWFEEPEMDLDA